MTAIHIGTKRQKQFRLDMIWTIHKVSGEEIPSDIQGSHLTHDVIIIIETANNNNTKIFVFIHKSKLFSIQENITGTIYFWILRLNQHANSFVQIKIYIMIITICLANCYKGLQSLSRWTKNNNNLWGYGGYIVHYISVDCLIISSSITFKR